MAWNGKQEYGSAQEEVKRQELLRSEAETTGRAYELEVAQQSRTSGDIWTAMRAEIGGLQQMLAEAKVGGDEGASKRIVFDLQNGKQNRLSFQPQAA